MPSADPIYDARILGRIIKHHREAARLTQDQLAIKSGIGSKKISRLEQGFTLDPGFADVILIANALGFSPNAIAERIGVWSPSRVNPENQSKDPRLEWIDGFLSRATPETRDQFLTLSYAAALTMDRVAQGLELPKHLGDPLKETS